LAGFCRFGRDRILPIFWAIAIVLDHPVCAHQDRLRNLDPERLCSSDIDHHFEFGRLFCRNAAGLIAHKTLVDVSFFAPAQVLILGVVTQQPVPWRLISRVPLGDCSRSSLIFLNIQFLKRLTSVASRVVWLSILANYRCGSEAGTRDHLGFSGIRPASVRIQSKHRGQRARELHNADQRDDFHDLLRAVMRMQLFKQFWRDGPLGADHRFGKR
jgi:hypothetical protein